MNIQSALLLISALWLTGCNTHVHEPWVSSPDYLKQERTISPELNQRLADRVMLERDR